MNTILPPHPFILSQSSIDSRFYVRLSLTYAGHPLGRIWPQDTSTYSTEPNNHSLLSRSPSTSFQSTRDTFYSDAGRTQTIISGFPKVLQFDQWFKFPGWFMHFGEVASFWLLLPLTLKDVKDLGALV